MSNIANKIKPNVKKVISKFKTTVEILRVNLNEFNESDGILRICTVDGYYHEGSNMITSIKADKGEIKRGRQKFLMVLHEDKTIEIQENDFFFIDGVKYIIKDKGNRDRLNYCFDMLLEVN